MKLANNFLSATTLVATSEAIAFGLSEGLDMATMLEVLNDTKGRTRPRATSSSAKCLPGVTPPAPPTP